jgi:soluble lytic murein transglycosylase
MGENDYQAAYALVSPHGQRQGIGFAQAEWLAGWLALRQLAKPQRAYRHFSSLYRGVSRPISLARGAYWTGRAADALGQQLIAGQWYHQAARHPTTFYGQLAMITLNPDQGLRLPVEPSISATARAQFDRRMPVQAARLLALLGERTLAREFVRRLGHLAIDGDEHRLVSQLAFDIGTPDIAVELSRRSIRDRVNLIRSGYPVLPYDIYPNVEPALAHAVIRQESSFRPAAVSRSNARGLMQLLPSTAKDVARRLGVQYPGDDRLLTDPATNVLLGSAYLDHLLERFDGSYVLAVVAYNVGPTRLSRWLRSHGDPRDPSVDPIDWIEELPLYEPRNYVQRVLEGLQVYRNLYRNTRGEPISRLLNDLSMRGGTR